jgi:hypothetical protein
LVEVKSELHIIGQECRCAASCRWRRP